MKQNHFLWFISSTVVKYLHSIKILVIEWLADRQQMFIYLWNGQRATEVMIFHFDKKSFTKKKLKLLSAPFYSRGQT